VAGARALLARQASSRPRLLAIAIGNGVLAVLLAIALWPSDLQMRMWPRVSGEVASVTAPVSDAETEAQSDGAATAATSATPTTSAAATTRQTTASEPMVAPDAAAARATAAQASQAAASAVLPSATGAVPAGAVSGPAAAVAPDKMPSAPASAASVADAVIAPQGTASDPPTTPAAAPTPAPAPITLADVDPATQGPAARAASKQQAALAALSRRAHLPTKAEDTAQAAATATAAASAPAPTPPVPPRSKIAPAARPGPYLINVGLFAQQENAVRAHAKLKVAGLPAISESLQTRHGERIRVRVGPFATRALADAAARRIRALQLEAVVVRP
jgi:cell division septation protein DedD